MAVAEIAAAVPMASDSPTSTIGRSERNASQTSSSTAASEPQPITFISKFACAAAASACSGMPAATTRTSASPCRAAAPAVRRRSL
ncbi:hypothetical protein D3C87_1195700 [compost metagenome]